MSLYNLLFGKNPNSDILKKILDLDQANGNWHTGRFRDIYVTTMGKLKVIALYTRNGGGNREECWSGDWFGDYTNKEKNRCDCPACTINNNLPKHPNYLYDKDDDFDCTYNTCYFSVPKGYELIEDIIKEPREKWDDLFENLKKKNYDEPAVQRALMEGEHLIKIIKEHLKEDLIKQNDE